MTGEECFKIGMGIKDISLVEAEKYFKKGADEFNHPKCMLKVAEITQDEDEKNVYYELAAERGEIDAVDWVIENLIAKKNYGEAQTKFNHYEEHLSSDCKTALQDKITFETLKDKREQGTISTEEMRVLAEHYESGTGTEKNLQEAKELQDRAKFLETSASAGAGDVESIFQLGRMYFHGEGTKRNLDKAQDCFEKADKAGHSQAKAELTEVIKAKGEEFFARGKVEEAAELGYFPAKLELIDKIPNESERLKAYEEFLSSLTKDNAPKSPRQQVASRISTLKQKMEFDNLKLKPESELNVRELLRLVEFYTDCRFAGRDNYKAKKLNNLADFKENKTMADANDPTACYEVAKMYLYGRGTIKNVYKAEYYIDKYRAKMPTAYDKLYELYNLLSIVLKGMADEASEQAKEYYNKKIHGNEKNPGRYTGNGHISLKDLSSIHID